MEKSRKIRTVTITQLEKSNSIFRMRKFVDHFFDEIGRRQKVNTSDIRFKQFKNTIKKRLTKAIKTGNRQEIKEFRKAVQKIIDDMNKPKNQPIVKIIEKVSPELKDKILSSSIRDQ